MNLQLAFVVISVGVWAVAGDGRYAVGVESESLQFLLRAWVWPARADVVPIVGLGVMSALIGYLMTQAYRLSRASVVAPFEYVLMIYSLFWGWQIFGEWPTLWVFVGAAVVISAGVYVFLREGQIKAEG
jgi:S-adenosylmethionine uptake transporter